MLKLCTLLLFLFSWPLKAELPPVVLLSLPLGDNTDITYSIVPKKECSFEGVDQVITAPITQTNNRSLIVDLASYLQKKINLEIDKQEITSEHITFSLKGSQNLFFEFFYKQSETTPSCQLIKALHFNDKVYNLGQVKIDYSTALTSAVVERIQILDEENKDLNLFIYPWQLKGQMSFYEFNVGPALNVHTNIRVKDQKTFQKKDPVIEPMPAFFFRYGPLFLNKNGLGSLLFHYKDVSLIGMGLLEGEPYQGPGLKNRSMGLFFGSILKFNLFELTFYNDFFKDKGYVLKANLAPEFRYRLAWKFSPQIFLQFWDKEYVRYYYGVKPEEAARSPFAEYKPSYTFNYGAMLETNYFVDRWTYVFATGVKMYGKEVFQSPTVDKQQEWRFIFSVLYKVF